MIFQRSVILCARTNLCRCRSISLSSIKSYEDDRSNLPSRKLFMELTEKAYMDEKLSRSGRKPFEAMVEKPIIIKNFFISELESEDIEYPEMMTEEKFNEWNNTKSKFTEHIVKNNIQQRKNDENQFEILRHFNLFGSNIPKMYGGQGYTNTERALIGEIETHNVAVATILNVHRLVNSTICEYGTEHQCEKYLPKLARGELMGTIAFEEWNTSDTLALNTRAEYDEDDEVWYLNGTKTFVVNAINANLFLVLAQTRISDRQGDKKNSLTIFLVDGSLPGVKIHPKNNIIGDLDSHQARVTFNDVKLAKDSVFSLPGTGSFIEQKVTMNSRICEGIMSLTQMKNSLQYMIDMVESIERQTTNVCGRNEAVTLRLLIGKYSCSIYSLESMLYLTTGIMDKYDNTNIDLETAIFKIYAQDHHLNMMVDLLNFVDSRVTLDEHPLNLLIRNAIHSKFSESKNELKLYIAREGIQYRLRRLIEESKNTDFLMKNFLTEQQLDMYEPEMQTAAKNVFDSVVLLRLCASTIIHIDSSDTKTRDSEMKKLADAAACIYASYACLLRANRSIKLKLPNAQHECTIAQTVCDTNYAEIKHLTQYVEDGPIKTFEKFHEYVTHLMLQQENKFPAHPLTRFS